MSDTYYDSAEDIILSQERAFQEFDEFLADMGDKDEYPAQEVLEWLGY